jgi:hypothetical protein
MNGFPWLPTRVFFTKGVGDAQGGAALIRGGAARCWDREV